MQPSLAYNQSRDLYLPLHKTTPPGVVKPLKAQWHMEQAAIRSGAMGTEGRSRGGVHVVDDAEGGGAKTLGTTHYSGGGGVDSNINIVGTSGEIVDGSGVAGGGPAAGGGEMPNGDSLEQIYQSTRMWCRTLRRSPNAMEVLLAFARKNPRPQSAILFNQYLSDLTGIMYRRLSTTVEEEVRATNVSVSFRCLLVGCV